MEDTKNIVIEEEDFDSYEDEDVVVIPSPIKWEKVSEI